MPISDFLGHSRQLLETLQSTCLGGEEVIVSQQEIQQVEKNLLASIALARSLTNAARPVNRIPSTALVRIFAFVQEGDWLAPSPTADIAQNSPALWTQLHIQAIPRHVQYFLDQSFPSPLRVFCGTPNKNATPLEFMYDTAAKSTHALRCLCDHLERIEELHFLSTFPVDLVLQKDRFSRLILPSLSSRRLPSSHLSSPTQTFDILSELFSHPAPLMLKLSLHGISITYMLNSATRYTTLTHLALYNQVRSNEQMDQFSDLDRLLDVLQATSRSLQSLILVRADISSNSREIGAQSKYRIISLPALRSIEIGDWVTNGHVAYFLAHLGIPGKAKRCIWGSDLKYLSSILFSIDVETAQRKERGWDSDINRVVFTSAKGGEMAGIYNRTVYIQGGLDFLSIYPLFRDQPQIFQKVEELCLTPIPSQVIPTAEEYRLLFTMLPNVRRLVMYDMDVTDILQVLGLYNSRTLREVAQDTVFPELREFDIRFSKQTDTSQRLDGLGKEFRTSLLSIVIGLTKLAQGRAKIGCGFEKMSLDLGFRSLTGDARDDCMELLPHLERWVSKVEVNNEADSSNIAKEDADGLVSTILKGIWPTNASHGRF
ncbi:hypothetical protein BDZ97DRAFT_2070702 [Flammula alnicola]|nr:hypothetical protein BDZ97DRAFT_2070702 [Flammula alnicola]